MSLKLYTVRPPLHTVSPLSYILAMGVPTLHIVCPPLSYYPYHLTYCQDLGEVADNWKQTVVVPI